MSLPEIIPGHGITRRKFITFFGVCGKLSDCRQNPGAKTFEQLIDSTGSIWEIPINRETTIVYGSKFAALHFTLWSYMNWLGIITRKGGYLLTKPYLLGWGLRVFFRWKIQTF